MGDDGDRTSEWAGQIEAVRGRGQERGLTPLEAATIRQRDGSRLEVRVPEPEGAISVRAIPLVRPPGPATTSLCPICLDPDPQHKEHVPQGDLGGVTALYTCARCNNTLGGRIEPALRDYFDGAYDVTIQGEGLMGRRRLGKVLLRESDDGKPVMFMSTGPKVSADIEHLFVAGGKFETEWRAPDSKLWKLALLKHAYLAACLCLGGVPDSPAARAVRSALVLVRDAPPGPPPSEAADVADGMWMSRTRLPSQGVAVSLDMLVSEEGEGVAVVLHLGGTMSVPWPLETDLLRLSLDRAGVPHEMAEDGGIWLEVSERPSTPGAAGEGRVP